MPPFYRPVSALGHVLAIALLAIHLAATVGCSGGKNRDPEPVVLDDGAVIPPSEHQDPFVKLSRAPGSSFVEIAEVRARDNGLVYYCSGVQGLIVLDASDPASIKHKYQLVSRFGSETFPRCQHVTWSGDVVYMSNRGDEIQPTPFVTAFDLSGSEPRQLGTYRSNQASLEGVAARGSFLYVARHGAGVIILELVGESFVERGSLAGLDNAWGLAIVDTTLYIADGTGGLVIADVANPDAPSILGRVATGGSAQSVEVDTATMTAWISAGAAGLVGVDVTDTASPTVVGRYDSPGSALQTAVAGDYAFVADWNDVRVVDISDRTAPRLLASERVDTGRGFPRVLGIGALGKVAFLGEWTGLFAYELRPEISAPDLWFEQRAVDFGPVDVGSADAAAVILENHGTAPLVLWAAAATGSDAFTIDRSQLIIPAGERAVLEVLFRPSSAEPTAGTLELWSDDPDEGLREIILTGNNEGVGVGDLVPEIDVALLNGGRWKLSEQRGSVVVLAYFATF